jgi:hypothetical protein
MTSVDFFFLFIYLYILGFLPAYLLINIENNQLVIVLNLRIPTSKVSELSIPNLDLGDEGFKV